MRPIVASHPFTTRDEGVYLSPVNLNRLIARRMARSNKALGSRPVVRIATYGVVLSVALMIIASAVVKGFQHEVKELIVGFDSHIQIFHSQDEDLHWTPEMLEQLRNVPGVNDVSLRIEKPGVLETSEAIQGVVIRGLDTTSFVPRILDGLVVGRFPSLESNQEILVGKPLANKLDLDTSSRVTLNIVIGSNSQDIRPRPLKVVGIYETGLLEFDERYVWISSTAIQDVCNRGAEGQVQIEMDSLKGWLAVGQAFGANGNTPQGGGRWIWNHGMRTSRRSTLNLKNIDASDSPMWIVGSENLADTVKLKWESELGWTAPVSKGSHYRVVDGIDVWGESLDALNELQSKIRAVIPYDWSTMTVMAMHPEKFGWLDMLDLNVDVIVGLLVLISIINMTSALLIIILERRSQIGLLKALGMKGTDVLKVFVWHAGKILGTGFVWGNVIGLILVGAQSFWAIVPLNPEAYYVDSVPILVDWKQLVVVESLAFGTCIVAMILPALWSIRIRPAMTMRMK